MTDLGRPLYFGPFGAEFTMPPFDPMQEPVEAMLRPLAVDPPPVALTVDEERELRIGIGRTDMEIRWLALLDDTDVLRLWRSWTGHEIYRATFGRSGGPLELIGLLIESEPDRHRLESESGLAESFIGILRHCLSLIMPKP